MLYEAYMDDSWTGSGSARVFTLSCLVATSDAWCNFARAWEDAMECGGAKGKILHMKNLVHAVGSKKPEDDFSGFTADKQKQLFIKLVPVVRQYVQLGLCGSLPMQLFEQFVPKPAKEKPSEWITPYILALQGTMEAVKDRLQPSKEDPVVFFMEQNQLVEADATRQFYHLTKLRGWEEIFPIITPLPKGPAPLQCADMVVYEGSRYSSEQVLGKSSLPPRTLFRELESSLGFTFVTASRELFLESAQNLIALHNFANSPAGTAIANETNRSYVAADKKMQRQRSNPRQRKGKDS